MAADFVPFLSAVRAKGATNISGLASAAAFSPMTGVPAATPPTTSQPTTPLTAPHSHNDISVDLKRTGDKVTQIRIQCRCGEVIELDCEY